MLSEKYLRQTPVSIRILVLITTFTLLWTGTFLHDKFGDSLSAWTQPVPAQSAVAFFHPDLGISKNDSCPGSSHLHSPLIAASSNRGSLHSLNQFLPVWASFILKVMAAQPRSENQTVTPLLCAVETRPKTPSYIIYQALLI